MPATTRRVLAAVLALALIAAAVVAWRLLAVSSHRSHTVEVGDLLSGVTVSGTVRCTQKSAIASEVLAAVRNVAVSEGQVVAKDQTLIELDDRVIAAECAKAQASVDLYKQSLAELKAGPTKEEITKAAQEVTQAESKLAFAEADHKKVSDLAKRGVATSSELDHATNQLKVAQAELKGAQAGLELLQAGTRPEQIGRAEAEVRLAEGELQRCQALRDKYVLKAPYAGVITAKHASVGEVVSPGQVLLNLNDIESVEIRAQVQENQLSGIEPGHAGKVLADAYPDQPLDAVVQKILPRVDPESGTVTVLLKLDKPPPVALMDGMAVDVALIRHYRQGVVRVPAAAVQGSGQEASVLLQKGRSFRRHKIVAGSSDGQWVEVKSGLQPRPGRRRSVGTPHVPAL
jgi:HlyD family secretion protein